MTELEEVGLDSKVKNVYLDKGSIVINNNFRFVFCRSYSEGKFPFSYMEIWFRCKKIREDGLFDTYRFVVKTLKQYYGYKEGTRVNINNKEYVLIPDKEDTNNKDKFRLLNLEDYKIEPDCITRDELFLKKVEYSYIKHGLSSEQYRGILL